MTDTRRDRDHTVGPPGMGLDELTYGDDELDIEVTGDVEAVSLGGAMSVLRRGIAASPELKRGLIFTIAMAVASSVGKLSIPLLVQQVIERGIEGGYDPGMVWVLCGVGVGIIVLVAIASTVTMLRLLQNSEQMLYRLRVTAFAKIHSLSVADHNETRRGQLVARVTADIDTIARFTEWGMASWILNGVLIIGTALVLLVLSWQLGLMVIGVFVVMLPVFRYLQRRQLAAYDILRDRVSDTLSEVSEAIGGGAVVRAYGLGPKTRTRLDRAVVRQYRAQMTTARYFALIFPIGDFFGTFALTVAVSAGVTWGDAWGLDAATLIAVLFLVTLIQGPIGELGEILDQTQTAISGWRKVIDVLDQPVDIIEPEPGVVLATTGPLGAVAVGVGFRYRTGGDVLRDVDLAIEAGTSVAVVGATGSGKTTFVKLLARLADPTAGTITIGGVPLDEVSPTSRHASIRMVPQDGFLFDTTVFENVSFGRGDGQASRADVRASFEQLGLGWWVDRLTDGLDTAVGERGENLSVGERQLVALARAQLADPGLLILDEATSAVDPETDQALTDALARLAAGRTMISVAHRLSTAEQADIVVVFDAGRIVEVGSHAELVASEGIYGRLHDTWLGNTRVG